jgi:transcriptional regulator with GAF, ATPase, and Fis domain
VLVGKSWPMVALRAEVAEIAPTGRPVLVLGETGAGKELVAQALHRGSGRAGAFVPVNCAALPEQLAESELFGYVRGAFTGAREPSDGLFGAADGGTLFLDEIGEIAAPLQAKLLRALATGEVRRVGETQARHVDARIVAATNVDLAEAIEDGAFRADLYARLLGTVLRAPPLRERREDVLALVAHFLRLEDAEVAVHVDAAEMLLVHRWPFNVRELEQVIRSAAPKARAAGLLEPQHLPSSFALRVSDAQEAAPAEAPIALRVARDRMPTGPELELVLRHFDGNIARVAEYFARDRKQIYRWAQRLGVGIGEFRG